jgi:hypothetical protein
VPKKRFTRVRREGKTDALRGTSLDGGTSNRRYPNSPLTRPCTHKGSVLSRADGPLGYNSQPPSLMQERHSSLARS